MTAPRPSADEPIQGGGRFAGFDVMAQADQWDARTRQEVRSRLAPLRPLAFFTAAEAAIAECLANLLLGQHEDAGIPLLAMIDARLAAGESDGWHYDTLPPDEVAWRQSLAWLDADAMGAFGQSFSELDRARQARLIQDVQDLVGDSSSWHGVPADQIWSLWTRYACTAFYSHPAAWSEIGFSGPAYPRGYINIGIDARDTWEPKEREDVDPVGFAARAEAARKAHAELTRQPGRE